MRAPPFPPKPRKRPGGASPPPFPVSTKLPRHPHTDDYHVEEFAAKMKDKLAAKRGEGRGGWDNKKECSAEFLSKLLRDHVEKGDPIDVANFCMMLHQRSERIVAQDITFPAPTSLAPAVWEFDRFINGKLMAEGVRIERASTFEEAAAIAARIAPRGPNFEVPVLIARLVLKGGAQ